MGSIKKEIKDTYGITLSNKGKKWDLRNALVMLSGLGQIDKALNGNLKSLVGGATFKLEEYHVSPENCNAPKLQCEYYGWTTPGAITFFTKGNAAVRQMNLYHKFGHLIDSLPGSMYDAFTNELEGASRLGRPSYVGQNGYLEPLALKSGRVYDPNHGTAQSIQASKATISEQWADIFANYVAGNIDLNSSQGKDMNKFITETLNPYITYYP